LSVPEVHRTGATQVAPVFLRSIAASNQTLVALDHLVRSGIGVRDGFEVHAIERPGIFGA
jgi:hypothetical protein